MKDIQLLPREAETAIKSFIVRKYEQNGLQTDFPNKLLRGDVLRLLDKFCTVVYYPVAKESNNGFHVSVPFMDGQMQDFVFINTAQTMEKQAFTAAHELGHIWNVDSDILGELGLENTPQNHELVINRFAAVLLIPEEEFKAVLFAEVKNLSNKDNSISLPNMYKLIVILMNFFFVPMKAIVLRMLELECLAQSDAQLLLGRTEAEEHSISMLVTRLIHELGFTELQNPSNKKWIDGLAEKLLLAEQNHLLPQEKIDYIRKKFDIQELRTDVDLDGNISLTT